MDTLDEAMAAESVQDLLPDSGHDAHVSNDVLGVGELDANLGEGGINRPHTVGDHVHCTPYVGGQKNNLL